MNHKVILFLFGISYTVLIHSAFAQQPEQNQPDELQSVAGAQRDDRQDTASRVRDSDQDIAAAKSVSNQDIENALLKEQIKQNSDTLALMNARNQFWLQVLQTIMPIISALGIGIVGWLQVKAARERHAMAQSINGMKTELVNVTRAAAFYEGAMVEAEKHTEGTSPTLARGQELSRAAEEASAEAHRLAAIAAGEKGAKAVPQAAATNVETINLAPGETASAEASKSGTTVTKDA